MAVRDSLARLFGAKASIISLASDELPDRALEKSYDDGALLSTYADDAWPYILANKIGEQASQAPLQVGTEDKDGEFTPVAADHPVQHLLTNPNPLYDGGEFLHLLMLYMELAGHAPLELVKARAGGRLAPSRRSRDGLELWIHNPTNWRIVGNADGTIKGYLWLSTSTEDLKWLPDQMTYLRWPNPINRWYGQGRIQAIRQQVMAEEYAAIRDKKFEKNLGVPPGILSSEMPLGEATAVELQKRWEKAVGGYNNAGKIAVLGSKTTYQAIAMTARDAEWLKQRGARVEVLAAGFGVPMPLLLMQDATFSNVAGARAEFWEGTLQPRLNRIARMLTHRLIPLITTEPLICRFDYTAIEALGENDLEAAKTATEWSHTGSVSVDEVRKRLGLNPHKDATFGERMLVPTTLQLQAADEIASSAALGMEGAQAAIDATRNPPVPPPTPPTRARKADTNVNRADVLSPVIEGYKRDLASYFAAQRGALDGAFKFDPDLTERVIQVLVAPRWRERIARISRLPIETGLTLGATEAAGQLGIATTFAIPASDAALAQVTGHLDRLGVGIQNTTVDDVRGVLTGALRDGVDNATIRARLDVLFDGYQEWRLDRISRTEVTSAYNLGAIGQYREAGIQTVLVSDGDKDEPCATANGAIWTLDQAESNPISHPNCTRTWVPDTSTVHASEPAAVKTLPDIHIHLPESLELTQQPPVVNVAPAEAPIVTVLSPEVRVESPTVNVAAPVVNVDTAPFTDALNTLQRDVLDLKAELLRPRRRRLVKDDMGRITGSEDE